MKKTHKCLHAAANKLLNIVLYSKCTSGGNCVIKDRISMCKFSYPGEKTISKCELHH